MFTMGTDFKYQYANSWFRQMDKFIHYVNKDGRVNTFYSTPSIYTDAKHAANASWPLKTEDFFPYADREYAYWTGYYTSRPALKGYVRTLSAYYLAARQLEFLNGQSDFGTARLADALAIAQHHDAVSGTEKKHVADDYAKRLAIGHEEAAKLVESSFACLVRSVPGSCHNVSSPKFKECPLLNISYCPPSESSMPEGKSLAVLIYNSLGWKHEDIIRVPVVNNSVIVRDDKGKEIESQLLPISNVSLSIRNSYVKAYLGSYPDVTPKFWLAFGVAIPPFGFKTYFISYTKEGSHATHSTSYSANGRKNKLIEVEQGNLELQFDPLGKRLTHYYNKRSMVKASLDISYGYYSSNDGGNGNNSEVSGAYIFSPVGKFPIIPEAPLTIFQGPILHEIHQQVNPWIHQIIRIYREKEHIEVEFMIGPIPTNDNTGKEVITQLTATMESNKTFYTDSNGRDFIKRIRDYRSDWELQVNQPAAGNYYPVNLGIYIKDNNTEMSILVDRAVGGSSLADGQIELMLHRRLLNDDNRGVQEPLDETVCIEQDCKGLIIQGKYYVRLDPYGEGAKWRRSFGQEIYSPLLIAFSEQYGENWANSYTTTFTMMDEAYSLPDNVALITLQELEDGTVLLRLAHLYEIGEHKDLSSMATVELKKMFRGKTILKIAETSLSANQERDTMEKKRLKWRVEGSKSEERIVRGSPVDPSKLLVELAPMEIRTFLLSF